MTSVFPEGLVETVAKAIWTDTYCYAPGPDADVSWDGETESVRRLYRRRAERVLSVAVPCVAGLIADRLDEWVRVMNPDAEFFGGPWDCAGFVRSEYGEQT